MTHLLDTSAWIAHAFGEPGGDRVGGLFQDPRATIGLSVLSVLELWGRLKREGHESAFRRDWPAYRTLFDELAAADLPVSLKAIELRRAATTRLPAIDALIAATAVVHGAILVHRDPHFETIPGRLLRQERLPDSGRGDLDGGIP